MIRGYNYTKRHNLPNGCAHITLHNTGVDIPEFDAQINLVDYDLPQRARVYLEAYYKSSLIRFDYGVVESLHETVAERHSLAELQGALPSFRLKVVDESEGTGRLIAQVDKIAPSIGDPTKINKTSLLYVKATDLKDRIWRLNLTGNEAMPILEVNASLIRDRQLVQSDPMFISLVFPSVVEAILTHILIIKNGDELGEDQEDNWQNLWMRYAQALPGVPRYDDLSDSDENNEDRQAWINDAVQGFCARQNVTDHFKSLIEKGSQEN